jgi:hypothetical protein
MQRAICEIDTGEPMKNPCQARNSLIALASAVLATFSLTACQESQQPSAPAASQSAVASTEKVFVVFEGPWAIVADPKDANSVLVLAPKTKLHRDLYVSASNESTLAAGTYDLSVPAHGAAFSGTLDPSFAQAKIDAKSLQRALDDKSGRYVIRLPKPEAYVAAKRFRSRVGPTYPPDASTEQNYAAYVSFRYSVSTLNGFSLAGTPDTGTFNPLLLQVDTPTIRFAIEPAAADDPKDMCSTHSREAFRDLVKFLNLTFYVDFPNDASNCHDKDPQKARPAKAEVDWTSPRERVEVGYMQNTNLVGIDQRKPSSAIGSAGGVPRYLTATMYLFHAGGGACAAPSLFLTTTP